MGTTCSCFRENNNEELIIINKENRFIQSKEMPEVIVDFNPLIDTNSQLYLKNVIKIQSVLRGFSDRIKLKPHLSNSSKKILQTTPAVFRDFLNEIDSSFPHYPNPTVMSVTRNLGEFDLSEKPDEEVTLKRAVKLENEAIYVGEWNSRLERHGRGRQNWIDGSIYEGYWKHDRANGKGRLIHADGDVYEGEWKDDKASGKGKYVHIDGSCYQGDWLEDKQHGYGVEIWPDGARYEGGYSAGRKHGRGKFLWADSSSYSGEFKDNNIHGYGIYTWGDGRVYEGEWKENKMNGKGKFVWNDGRMYIGEYVDDKKQGFGTFSWPDGRKYEGLWLDGKPHGNKRPLAVCYCAGLPNPKVHLPVKLVVLQDPREEKQAFNSVRLLERSIENIEVKKGRYFPEENFKREDYPNPILIYPSRSATSSIPEQVGTIILIDATWSFAKSLYNKNVWLAQIPNILLTPVNQPIYSALRKPPKPGLVSTAEALIILLENLGDVDSSNQLRKALQFAVDAEPWQKEHFKT